MRTPAEGGEATPSRRITDAASGGPWGPVPDAVEKAAEIVAFYVNPFINATGLVPERTDQGVDFGGDADSEIVAIGKMRITRATTDSGWPGPYGNPSGFNGRGGCIQGVLLEGPHKGEELYLAEYIHVDVKVGQIIKTGQRIARFYHSAKSGVGIEIGWVRPGTNQPCSTDTSGRPTQGGINFTRWLNQLGCRTQQHFAGGSTFCPCGKH